MKTMKRFLALLLVLAMTLSNLPVAVLADELSELTTEETITAETMETPSEEETEAPSEEETTAPSEEPSEAPAEETDDPTEDNGADKITNDAVNVGNGLPIVGIYTGSIPGWDNLISDNVFVADPDEENVFYYGFNRYYNSALNCTYEPIDGAVNVSHPNYVTVEKVSNVVYKLTLTDTFFEDMEASGSTNLTMTVYDRHICHWYSADGTNETHEEEDTFCTFNVRVEEDRTVTVITAGAYLTMGWLQNDGNGFYEGEVGNDTEFGIMPGNVEYQIYYLHYYPTEDATEMSVMPVHVQLGEEGSMCFDSAEAEAADGQLNAEYFYKVTTDTWDQELSIVHVLDENISIGGVTAYTNRHELCAYTSTNMTNDTVITCDYPADLSENAVNELYVGLDSDWTAESIYVSYGDNLITLEDTENANVKRVVITEEGMNLLRDGITLYVAACAQNDEGKVAYANWSISPDLNSIPHEPFLTFGWLNEQGNGWYENDEHIGDTYRVMPGQEVYHIYYLNAWNAETGELESVPVQVQAANGDLTLELVGAESAAEGQANGDYFYRVTTGTWDQQVELVTTLEDGTTVGGVLVHTDRNEVAFYTSTDMSNDTVVTNTYLADLSEGAENTFYVGLDSSYWMIDNIWVEDWCSQWIYLEECGLDNMRRVRFTDAAMEMLNRGEGLWIGVGFDTINESGDDHGTFYANCGVNGDLSSVDPFLSFAWLDNSGDGFFEQDDRSNTGFGFVPGDEYCVIFYLNQWSDEEGAIVQTPVHVTGSEHLFVNPVTDIAEGQENGGYFVVLSTDIWDEHVPVTYTMADGTVLTMQIWTGRHELGWYTSPELSNDTWFGNKPLEIDPFEENSIYLGLNNSEFNILGVYPAVEDMVNDFDLEQLNEKVWKITLTEKGLARLMDWYLLGCPLTVDLVNIQDESRVESRFVNIDFSRMELECDAWLAIDEEQWELFVKDGQQLWGHAFGTGEYDEDGNEIWTKEIVTEMCDGLSYDYATNTLTMEDYSGRGMILEYGWYDEMEDVFHKMLPSNTMTIELKGDNRLESDVQNAIYFHDLNVTFTGDGSLYVKSTNSPDNLLGGEEHRSFPAMAVRGGSVTFADSVNVTVEIAGEALEDCWEDDTFLGSRPAHLNALETGFTTITLRDDATLTTVVPEGASNNGPFLSEDDECFIWGDHTPGGYSGIFGACDLNVYGGTLNTQTISLVWGEDEEGNPDCFDFNQTGGTVNVDALAYNGMTEQYERNEETGEDEYVGDISHVYYVGLDVGPGSKANISGGVLNIDTTPTAAEMNYSTDFNGINAVGAELNISGGEINFTNDGYGMAIFADTMYDDEGNPQMGSVLNISGGTLNISGEEGRIIDGIRVRWDSTANFTGGTINTEWTNWFLRSDVLFENTVINGTSVFMEFNGVVTMNSGEILLDGISEIAFAGDATMNGGKIDIHTGMLSAQYLHHFGGDINIWNQREGNSWASFIARGYYEMHNDASLTIYHEQLPPAFVVEGTFHQMGGTVDVTHVNAVGEPAVIIPHHVYEDGTETHGTMLLNDGTFNICTTEDGHILGLNVDEGSVLFVGGMAEGHKPVLTLTDADIEGNGVIDLKQDAVVNLEQGTLNMFPGTEIIMDMGAQFTMNVSKEHSDDWDIAFLTGNDTSVTIGNATLTITTEGYDCAFDLNGDYTQNGGHVTVNNVDGDMAMAVKGIATFNGGTTNLSGQLGYSQVYEPTMSENSRFVFNRGANMYVNAKRCGIEILSAGEINGGSLNVNVSGHEFDAYDPDGNLLGRVMQANGILLNGWNYEDSELVINGGTHRINVPQSVQGNYFEADTNGIRALQGKLDIRGCRMFIKAMWPIVSNSDDESDMLTLSDGMNVYSLNTGAYLVPVDCTVAFDAEGNLTEDLEQASIIRYLRSFAEDNAACDIYTGEGIDSYVLVTPNIAGETLTWKLVDGTLTFAGEGDMYDFSEFNPSQWIALSDFITDVEIDSNVSYVGDYAFNGLQNLSNLNFVGKAPVFGDNAFAGVKARANYPYGEPTWTVELMQNYGGDITWVHQYESEEVIELVSDKDTLLPGEKAALTATVFPNIDPSVKVVWSLGEGDKDFVTLKDTGNGTATITAKKNKVLREVTVYATTNLSETEAMSVTLTIVPVVTKVNILNGEGTVITGTTQTLYMSTEGDNTMALYAENDPDGSHQEVTWKSSNVKYATVDENGIVTAVTAGKTVTITATATDGSRKAATVKIKTVQPMEDVTLPDQLVIGSGKSITLKAEIFPANTTDKKLVWDILDDGKNYASITSSGKLTAKVLTDGTKQITVRVSAKADPTVFADCVVTIYPAVKAVTITSEQVAQIGTAFSTDMDHEDAVPYTGSLNSKTVTLYMSSDREDTCNTLDLDAFNDPADSAQEWTWKSSNVKYATVDEEGVVTAVTAGKTATITATATDGSGKKATVKVKTVQPMEEVVLPETAVAATGKTITLKAEILPSDTTNKKLVWSLNEDDKQYATISTSGKLKVKAITEMQTVTVRVAAAENPDVYDECEVTLYPTAVNKVDIQQDGISVTGKTLTLVMASDGENTMDLTTVSYAKDLQSEVAQEVTWKSSNTKYATVDEYGTVTVLEAGAGKTVTITATAADGSARKATVKIKAIQPMEDLQLKENLVLDEYSNPIIAGGKSLKLATAVDIFPANTTNKKLTWSVSENGAGISVNPSTGVLATKKVTEPVIVEVKAVAQDGYGAELTFDVTVYPATTKVTLYNGGRNVTGKTLELPEGATAVIAPVNEPSNAAGLYTWKTSNTDHVTVEDGVVTGLVVGKTVTITATTADGTGKKATVKIKVVEAVEEEIPEMTEAKKALAEAEIRRALSLLIDRNAVSMGQVPASSFVALGMTDADGSQFYQNAGGNSYPGYWNTAAGAYAANCAEAVEILAKYYDMDPSGKFTGIPELTYIYNDSGAHGEIAAEIREMLASVGITIHLEGQGWNDLQINRSTGNYDIARHGWISDYNDPIGMLDMWTSYSGNNDAQLGKGAHADTAIYDLDLTPWGYNILVKNGTWAQTYDVLINVIKSLGTDPVRYELMHLAEDMLMESGCIVPLYYYTDGYLLDNSVAGFGTNPMGMKFFHKTTVNGSSDRISAFLCWEPGTMDPALNSDLAVSSIIHHMFSGLAKCAPDASGSYTRVVADCAEELVDPVVNADGTVTYTYTLKDGLVWSDGVAVTAHDFEFAWKRAASSALNADYGYMFEEIKGYPDNLAVTASDDKTLSVTLNSNISYWNELLAFTAFLPVREDVVSDGAWATNPETYVTNGAYTMTAWNHDSCITVQKNAAYWDAANVTMQEINFHLNGGDAQSNWISGAWQFVDSEIESLISQYPNEFHMASNLGTYFLLINANQPLLP